MSPRSARRHKIQQELNSLRGRSLFLFGKTNPVRKAALIIINNNKFEAMVIALILISSCMLTLDDPFADPNTSTQKSLDTMDDVFTVIFTLECTLKIITYGFFFNGKGSYLRNSWNILGEFLLFKIYI